MKSTNNCVLFQRPTIVRLPGAVTGDELSDDHLPTVHCSIDRLLDAVNSTARFTFYRRKLVVYLHSTDQLGVPQHVEKQEPRI
jgi:hypothetical protein